MMMKLLHKKTDSDHNVETAQTEPQPSTSGVQETEDHNATTPTTNSIPNNHQGKEETQSQHCNIAPQTYEEVLAEIDDLLHSDNDTEEITENPTKHYSKDKNKQNNIPKAKKATKSSGTTKLPTDPTPQPSHTSTPKQRASTPTSPRKKNQSSKEHYSEDLDNKLFLNAEFVDDSDDQQEEKTEQPQTPTPSTTKPFETKDPTPSTTLPHPPSRPTPTSTTNSNHQYSPSTSQPAIQPDEDKKKDNTDQFNRTKTAVTAISNPQNENKNSTILFELAREK